MAARVNLPWLCAATLLLALSSAAALGMLGGRVLWTGDPHFAFLGWNLLLAWVPFLLAVSLYAAHRAKAPDAALLAGFVPWLLFLPNAPYIVTDFVHLAPDTRVPLWFDFALLSAFAASGLLLGFASVYVAQVIVAERRGSLAGWALPLGAFVLSAVGIYVGRVLRFNSWDAWQDPRPLWDLAANRAADPLGNPLLIAMVALFTGFMLACYVALYLVSTVVVRTIQRTLSLR